jgi:hypothetical protein
VVDVPEPDDVLRRRRLDGFGRVVEEVVGQRGERGVVLLLVELVLAEPVVAEPGGGVHQLPPLGREVLHLAVRRRDEERRVRVQRRRRRRGHGGSFGFGGRGEFRVAFAGWGWCLYPPLLC